MIEDLVADLDIDFKCHICKVLSIDLEYMFCKAALRDQPQICFANPFEIT